MLELLSLTVVLDLAAATADDKYVSVPIDGEWVLDSITLVPNSTVATDGSDYRTTTFKVGGTGGTTVGSQTTNSSGGSARTVGVAQRITLTTPEAYPVSGGSGNAGVGDCVVISSAKTGSTGAVDDATYILTFRKRRV